MAKQTLKGNLRIEWIAARNAGGQHNNRNATCCRVTHLPTGIQASADERSRRHSERLAMKRLRDKLEDRRSEKVEKKKKQEWRDKKDSEIIRTYDYTKDAVIDKRSGKRSTIKRVLKKGLLDDLRDL